MKNLRALNFILISVLLSSCSSIRPRDNLSEPFYAKDNCAHSDTTFSCVEVVEVYDGDTIFINLPDQHPLFGKRMGVRIVGIDTPEIRTKNECEKKKSHEAKKILERIINNANRVDIVDVKKDKFFRILGTVLADGQSVTKELIQAKLAYPYHGEKKPKRDWCKN